MQSKKKTKNYDFVYLRSSSKICRSSTFSSYALFRSMISLLLLRTLKIQNPNCPHHNLNLLTGKTYDASRKNASGRHDVEALAERAIVVDRWE